jgi:Tfp pilus assembly protein PilV
MSIATEPLRRLRKRSGYSLAESLLALLIILLLSAGIAGGVAFAVRQYNEAMIRSEAKVLCSSLSNVLRNELSITSDINPPPGDEGKVRIQGFISPNYAGEGTGAGGETKCCPCTRSATGSPSRRAS